MLGPFKNLRISARIKIVARRFFLFTYLFLAAFSLWSFYHISPTYDLQNSQIDSQFATSSCVVENFPHITLFLSNLVTSPEIERRIILLIVNHLMLVNDLQRKEFLTERDVEDLLKNLFNLEKTISPNGSIQYRRIV